MEGVSHRGIRALVRDLALTKLCNFFTNTPDRESHRGYGAGLKPVFGGSIPSFLSRFSRKLVLRRYDREAGIRVVTLGLLS